MSWKKNIQNYYLEKRPIVFGHRGSPTYKTENTLSSFKKAIQQKVDGLELDVRCTKDKKVVIFHDKKLDRIAGIKSKVKNLFYDDLKKIVLNKGETIPLLDDISPLLKNIKVLNIEIKSDSIFSGYDSIKPVLNFIRKNQIEKKCIVSCFNPLVLLKVKCHHPKIILGYLYNRNVPFHAWHNYVWIKRVKPDNLHIHYSLLDSWVVKWARKNKLYINSYTINDKNVLNEVRVDGVFTDNIEYLN